MVDNFIFESQNIFYSIFNKEIVLAGKLKLQNILKRVWEKSEILSHLRHNENVMNLWKY